MNKEISVQYAYKKDGKGERHGDQAERTLATQARKHNVQPLGHEILAGILTGTAPRVPNSALEPDITRLLVGVPGLYMNGTGLIPGGSYQSSTLPQQPRHTQQLPAPPTGLPARPPPSQVGYGGPHFFPPSSFKPVQSVGFAAPIGQTGLPSGFQPTSFVRNR